MPANEERPAPDIDTVRETLRERPGRASDEEPEVEETEEDPADDPDDPG
jgi:hypothetical protein